ncbi:MAG: hypothetical protein DRO88_01525 [Promethearchaeia archaeon]|nr:MAG: hypothetical protein DRO88_01525 [Candidatus Lokiarchaeia archaeon]
MSIKDFLPIDPEIEQFQFDKKITESINKQQYLEDGVRRALNELANQLKKSAQEIQHYLVIQRENERNYIQLINRKSDLVLKSDLSQLRTENSQMEQKLQVQEHILNSLLDLSNDYKEYTKTLKNLGKIMEKLNKSQSSWRDAAAELAKLRGSQMASGGKLQKVENKIEAGKASVIKIRSEVKHRKSFVLTTLKRINETLLKLKNGIKSFIN